MSPSITEHDARTYRSEVIDPVDFDAFWSTSIARAEQHPLDLRLDRHEAGLMTIDVFDVTFRGSDGDRVRAWLRLPAATPARPLPCVIQFVGYGGGRGHPEEALHWASAGFAHLHVDTRGQGSVWSPGSTPDPHGSAPSVPGFTTRGIEDPDSYYYRRLVLDAVRAVEAAAAIPAVDPSRIAALGFSQGGYLALAAAALAPQLRRAFSFVPFLCEIPRALAITDTDPYGEITRYLSTHRGRSEHVLRTLSYFDGVAFARRARVPVTFSTGLRDDVCPPSTVFAAYHACPAPRTISVWPHNGHEGGGIEDERAARIDLVRTLRADAAPSSVNGLTQPGAHP